jgi:TonB-linked SusC/RagA family outer membrane protein
MSKLTIFITIFALSGLQLIFAQGKIVSGVVTDGNTNDPLPGVNVLIKGTTTGTVTGIEGDYSINVPGDDVTLSFSFIGYLSEEILIGGQTNINIVLIPDVTALSEVVVVGYGSMERTNVTGAISTIKTEELSKAPVPNLVEAMRAQVAGARIKRTSGQPGSGVEFLIRGKNSLSNSNEPLIVLDGVPTTGGNIAELNSNDIESVNILKDAAAASIYGARGANGVILITTKEGNKDKPTFNINLSHGFTDLVQKPDLMNAEEFVQFKIDAAEGAGQSTALEDVLGDAVEYANYTNPDGIQEIDWHDELLRIGKVTNAGLSLSGGTEKISFYLNGDAYLENGIVQQTSYNRYSFRLNTNYEPYDFVKIGARVQLSKTSADETGNSAVIYQDKADFTDFISNTPLGRIYNENNELVPTVKGDQFDYNPLYKYRESETDRSTGRFFINPYIEFKILKGLTYRINASAEQRSERYFRFTSSKYDWSTLEDTPGRNYMKILNAEPVTYLFDNIISYKKDITNKHSINGTFVYGFQTYSIDTVQVEGEGSPTDLLSYNSISNTIQNYKDIYYVNDEWANMYYVGRVGYAYDRKYVLTFTGRYDGSTIFGPDKRWGFFPSASFAWNISEEYFLQNITAINLLKYRISYGTMGNDQIGTYGYVALTYPTTYPFNQVEYTGYRADKFENKVLQWETSKQFNTGIDFGILNNTLNGSVDYYNTNTVNLILNKQIPPFTGFPSGISNIGETKNYGLEINLDYKVLKGELKWEIGANWAFDRNKIIRLNDAVDENGDPVDDEGNGWFLGEDIDVVYDWDFIGIWQEGEEAQAAALHPDKPNYGPGDPKIRDVDGNDTINFEDKTFLGSPTPKWYGGLRNTFRYKGLELTILFEAVRGVTRINYFYGNYTDRSNEIKIDYWTPLNPTNNFPQPSSTRIYDYQDAVRVRDASFVALRNISLAYNLPQDVTERLKIAQMQVYIRGNNLKYFTEYKDAYSPESEYGRFPITKNWTIGTNITF